MFDEFDIICTDKAGNPIEYFTQWDSEQIIYIRNLGLAEAPIIHYCNANSKQAFAVQSTIDNGAIICEVPNEILQENLRVLVYVYEYDHDTRYGKNLHVGKFEVRTKTKPQDYLFHQNIKVVNLLWLDGRVRYLLDRDQAVSSAILALQDKDTALANSINTANANIATNAGNIEALEKYDKDFKTAYDAKMVEIGESLAKLSAKDESLDSNIKTISTNIGTNSYKIGSLEGRMTIAESEIDTANANIATNSEAIETLSGNIQKVSDSLVDYALVGESYTKAESDEMYATKSAEHTHTNMDLLEEITEEDIANWNAPTIPIDETLSKSGEAADAAAVGENVYYVSDYVYSSMDSEVVLVVGTDVQVGDEIKIAIGEQSVSITSYPVAVEGGLPSLGEVEQVNGALGLTTYKYITVSENYTSYEITGAVFVIVTGSSKNEKSNIKNLKTEVEELRELVIHLAAQVEALSTT